MTIPDNYNNLVQAIQEELEDTSSDFVASIPRAIRNAEERINRDIDGLFNQDTTDVNTVIGTRTITKPQGHKLSYDLNYLDGNGILQPLLNKTQDFLSAYWPVTTSTAPPKYYADISKTQIILAPTPDAVYPVTFAYAKANDFLSTANQTNNIITYYQDLLFNAALVYQCGFARMDEAFSKYSSIYNQLKDLVSEETRRERQDNTSPRHRTQVDENRKDSGSH